MTAKQEREAFLSTVIKAMHYIFGNVTSPFVRVKVMDLLFGGLPFKCSGSEFAVKALCATLKSEGPGVRIVNETHLSISLLGHVSCHEGTWNEKQMQFHMPSVPKQLSDVHVMLLPLLAEKQHWHCEIHSISGNKRHKGPWTNYSDKRRQVSGNAHFCVKCKQVDRVACTLKTTLFTLFCSNSLIQVWLTYPFFQHPFQFSYHNSQLSVWDGDECNRLRGTDSTIFPPFLEREEGLWTFTPDICMSLRAHYVRESSFAGLPTSVYSLNLGDFQVKWMNGIVVYGYKWHDILYWKKKDDESRQCFCVDETCPPRGTLDLLPCLGSRIYGMDDVYLFSFI